MVVNLVVQLIFIIVSVAFFTLLERKVLGYIHLRRGPNKPRLAGLIVPFADAIKLFRKEENNPQLRNKVVYLITPVVVILIPMLLWSLLPLRAPSVEQKHGLLLFLCYRGVGVYGILGAGWSANAKYRQLGAFRAVAQSISYEVSLSLLLLRIMVYRKYNLIRKRFILLVLFIVTSFLIVMVRRLAETNRSPFDFAEGESELVRGFNTEYRAVSFVILFLAEYISIIFIRCLTSIVFWNNSWERIIIVTIILGVLFIWARGSLPRFRYDQLIHLAWKRFLPARLGTLTMLFMIS